MTGPELTNPPDILTAYHAIDPVIPVGRVPLAVCQQIREQAGDPAELTPNQRLEYAWVGLEGALAMAHEPDPETGRKHNPRRQNIALKEVRAEFQALFEDESLPLALRTRAGITLAGIETHKEVNTARKKDERPSPNYLRYLADMQKVARPLAEQGAATNEEMDLTEQITSLIIMNEYNQRTGWFTLASPRQPWHINGFNRLDGRRLRIMVTDETPYEHTIAIPRSAVGDHLWNDDDQYEHGSTLRAYMRERVGLGITALNRDAPNENHLLFSGIYFHLHLPHLNEKPPIIPPPYSEALGKLAMEGMQALVGPSGSEQAQENKEFAELKWFTEQDSYNLNAIHPSVLAGKIAKLEQAQARGELNPGQLHALGWMQLDLARLRASKKPAIYRRIDSLREQAKTADRKLRGPMISAANSLAIEATETEGLFDKSAATMAQALELPAAASDRLEIQIDSGAIPVYKAHYMGREPAVINKALGSYLRGLAALLPQFKDAERRAAQNPDEWTRIRVAAIRATIVMLISGSSDEGARHLALPASIRAGGAHGEIEAVAFPYDFSTDGYDLSAPVSVQCGEGDIQIHPAFVEIGISLLISAEHGTALLEKLTRAIRSTQGSYARARHRGKQVDKLTLRVSDAIVDASEME